MAIDADAALAYRFEPQVVTVERGRLAFFAKATGQRDPVYSDLDAAQAAGHPDLPVPPSFYFSLELERPDPFDYLTALGVDLRRILHGEQSFTYHAMAYAGDRLTLRSRVVDLTVKKKGALEVLTKSTSVLRDDQMVAEAVTVIVVRNPEGDR
ncbi:MULTISPECIES: MaoC family dehydratase N-terminal domain-containing protein [unclassified Streptomyces]|uniref:MaoC family dehydratase N-terminal domain-containing protein n=1 Tax=unclassified Streptomyces TaxID=2593676 RepID=UPI00093B1B21|nr:MaoC family dehydratase N-terminal domain-containing protein [Streptomyces sp. TSRI0107]OKJ74651.1 acyl dehydratase [Streptomyces sp. TSRI0107]